MARIGSDTRYVRTAEGSQFYSLPIGAPIRPDVITKRNRQAATMGIRPPQGAIEDSRGRVVNVPDARPEVKVGDPTLSGTQKFKVGDREFTAPEGSRLFARRGNDGMRYVMTPDGSIYGFNRDGQADVPEALQETLAERFESLDESDDRYEELDFDGGTTTDAVGGSEPGGDFASRQAALVREQIDEMEDGPSKQEATRLLEQSEAAVPEYREATAEYEKYRRADNFDTWLRENGGRGSGTTAARRPEFDEFMVGLRERHAASQRAVTEPLARAMRLAAGIDTADDSESDASAPDPAPGRQQGSALDELRARRDSTLDRLREIPDENAVARTAADAPVGARLLDSDGQPQFEKVAGGWQHSSGVLAPVPDDRVQAFLDSGELTIEGREDEKSFGEMTQAEFEEALSALPTGTSVRLGEQQTATKLDDDVWHVEGAVTTVGPKDLYFFKNSIEVVEDEPDPDTLQAGDVATPGFIRSAPAGSQISYVSEDEVEDIEQTRVTVWTKRDDGTWASETSGGVLAEHVVIDALDERTLIARVGPEGESGDLYPGARRFAETDVRAAYDGLVEHTGFQVFYGVPQGNPLRDREVIGALTADARSKYPSLSPKQAVLAHLRDYLGIESPEPDNGPSSDEPTLVVGAPDPKRTGVQGMSGGQFTRADIEDAISILEGFEGKAFKAELNKRGNRLGELDPSSIVGIHKDKTVAKDLFVEHLRGVLANDIPSPDPEPTPAPDPEPDPDETPQVRTPEELIGQSPETLEEVQQLPVGSRINFLGIIYARSEDRRWRSLNDNNLAEGGFSDEDLGGALRGITILRVDTPADQEVPRPNWTIGEYRVGESIVARHPLGTSVWTRLPDEDGSRVWSTPNGGKDYEDNLPEAILAFEEGFNDPSEIRWFKRSDPQAPENPAPSPSGDGTEQPENPAQQSRFTPGQEVGSADLQDLPLGTRMGYTRKKDGRVTYYTKRGENTYVTDKGTEVDVTSWRNARFVIDTIPEGVGGPATPPEPAPDPTPEATPVDIDTIPVGGVVQVTINVDGDSDTLGYEGSGWKAGETRYLRKNPYGGWETSDAQGFNAEYQGRYGTTRISFSDDEVRWMQRNGIVTTDFDAGSEDPRRVRSDTLLDWSREGTLRGRVLEIEGRDGSTELVRNVVDGAWLRPNGHSMPHGTVISFSEEGRVRTPEDGTEWTPPENALASQEQMDALRPGSVIADNYQGFTYVKQDDGTWMREGLRGPVNDPIPATEIWDRVSRYESPGGWQVSYSAPGADEDLGVQAGDRVLTRQVQDLPVGSIVNNDGVYSIVRSDGTTLRLNPQTGPDNSSADLSDYHAHVVSRDVEVIRVGAGTVPGKQVPDVGESFDVTDVDLMLSMPTGTRFSGPRYVRNFSSRSGLEDTTYVVAADGVLIDESTGDSLGVLEFSNVPMSATGERKPDPTILDPRPSDSTTLDTIEALRAVPVGSVLTSDGDHPLVKVGENEFATVRSTRNGTLSTEQVLDHFGRTRPSEGRSLGVSGETSIASEADLEAVKPGTIVYDASDPRRTWLRNADGSWLSTLQTDPPTFSGDLRAVPAASVPTKQRSEALPVQVFSARKGTRLRVAAFNGKNITYEFDGRLWTETGTKRYKARMAPASMFAMAAGGRARVWGVPEDDTKALIGVDVSNDEQFWSAFSALSDEGSIEMFAKRRLPDVNWVNYTVPASKTKAERDDYVDLYREYIGATIQFFEHYPQLQAIQSVGAIGKQPRNDSWAYVQYSRGAFGTFSDDASTFKTANMRFHMTSGLRHHLERQGSQSNFHVSGSRDEISAPLRTVVHESGHVFDTMTNMRLGTRAQDALDEYLGRFPREQRPLIRAQFGTYSHTNTKELVAVTFELWHTFDEVDPAVDHVMAAIQDEFRDLTDQPDFEFKKYTGSSFSQSARHPKETTKTIEQILTEGNSSRVGEPIRGTGYGYLSGTVARVGDVVYEKDGSSWYELDSSGNRVVGEYGVHRSAPSWRESMENGDVTDSEILREGIGYSESSGKPFSSPADGYVRSSRKELLDAAEPGSTIVIDGVVFTKGADGFWYSESGLRVSTNSMFAKIVRNKIPGESTKQPNTEAALIELDNLMFSDYIPTSVAQSIDDLRSRG